MMEEMKMELTAELTKAFGGELAKIFSSTIPEEEIKELAHKAYADVSARKFTYHGTEASKLETAISELVLGKILEEIKEQLNSDEGKQLVRESAERIIKTAREKSEGMLVDVLASHICSAHFPNGDMMGLANQIAYAIRSTK